MYVYHKAKLLSKVVHISPAETRIDQNYFIKKFMSHIYYQYSIFNKIHAGGFSVNTNFLKYKEASSFISSVFTINLTIYFKKRWISWDRLASQCVPVIACSFRILSSLKGTDMKNVSRFCFCVYVFVEELSSSKQWLRRKLSVCLVSFNAEMPKL